MFSNNQTAMIRKEFTVKEDEESYKLNLDAIQDEEDDDESVKELVNVNVNWKRCSSFLER